MKSYLCFFITTCLALTLFSCQKAVNENETTDETIYGDYHLVSVLWHSNYVNLDNDEFSHQDLLLEYRSIPGYLGPHYLASVSFDKGYSSVSFSLPYPVLSNDNNSWTCSAIETYDSVLYPDEEEFKAGYFTRIPALSDNTDYFLRNVEEITVEIDSEKNLQISLLCSLPCTLNDGSTVIKKSYLSHIFVKNE